MPMPVVSPPFPCKLLSNMLLLPLFVMGDLCRSCLLGWAEWWLPLPSVPVDCVSQYQDTSVCVSSSRTLQLARNYHHDGIACLCLVLLQIPLWWWTEWSDWLSSGALWNGWIQSWEGLTVCHPQSTYISMAHINPFLLAAEVQDAFCY